VPTIERAMCGLLVGTAQKRLCSPTDRRRLTRTCRD